MRTLMLMLPKIGSAKTELNIFLFNHSVLQSAGDFEYIHTCLHVFLHNRSRKMCKVM